MNMDLLNEPGIAYTAMGMVFAVTTIILINIKTSIVTMALVLVAGISFNVVIYQNFIEGKSGNNVVAEKVDLAENSTEAFVDIVKRLKN